jgi:peptidyl-prolyl cis-trans isomerase C
MPRCPAILTSLAFAAALALPAAAAPTVDTVVARVNGEEITLGHVMIARVALPQQYQQLPPDVLYTAILDQLIQQTALKQAGPDSDPTHVRLALENERRSLLAAEVIEDVMRDAAGDDAIRAAYEARYADGFGAEEFDAAHILVETEEEALEVRKLIEDGADFAETAKAKSTGPSGPNGGALGWFGAGQMVPEFEAAVLELEPGQVSAPVQTQFGWHIVKLNDKRRAEAPKLEDVRDELAGELQRDAVTARVEALVAASQVEHPEVEGLSPEIILDVDMLRN